MTDLTRYAYDARTKVYAGVTEALPDPMNSERLLEPAFTTAIAPGDVPLGQAAVWNGAGWTLTQDHRGETWFKDTTPVLIDFLGDPAAQGMTPDAPPLPEPPPPSSCSKLGLKRAFDEKGLWSTVRAMIASSAEMQEDWDLAIELRISDPIVREAVAGLAQLGIPLSDADVQALVTRANELVA
ncbi:hypothetical protein [Methylobacterium sp. OT2]|uniref:hypothetical protein n=1 Tax=Methylobacterium sp. OT2 TaxID=2813779 RepID=UPI00197BD85A|nr:hypothetical protein [Methylobacterium sp. OT2]MBN4095658.1 hypothetical protein [Methylobacterium sp. OT2]